MQLRAVLIPLAVALALVAGLMWYRLFWIPAQQQYLNERNSRILRTVAAQIASKIDSFDLSIDNAMDTFRFVGSEMGSFPKYVKLFAADVEVVDNNESHRVMNPGDPPRVVIQRDEGTNFLYLGYKHEADQGEPPVIEVRSDIEQVVRPFFETRTEFEALILADATGRAIAQYSPSEFRLDHLDMLAYSPAGQSPSQGQKLKFDAVRLSSQVASVTIGEVPYMFYSQPVVLSLIDDQNNTTAAEWTLCGLVRADRFGAASVAISPSYWLLFVEALLVICLGVPILKVQVLKPRERFNGSDGAWVTVTTFLLAGVITVAAFDAYCFSYRFENHIDAQLGAVATAVKSHLQDEMAEIGQQADDLEKLIESGEEIKTSAEEERMVSLEQERDGQERIVCRPVNACKTSFPAADARDNLAGVHQPTLSYPYFDLVSWTDKNSQQLVKWSTTRSLTPFINLRATKIRYFDALERANLMAPDERPSPVARGIAVLRSPTTGNNSTVFWEALGTNGTHRQKSLYGLSMTMKAPLSVFRPTLPRGVQFTVIDATGLVMYHSDPPRSLNENFFQETEDSAAVRAAIRGRQSLPLTTQYLGITQRLFVTPLPLTKPGAKPAVTLDPGWSLAVFQPVDVPDTVNLEALIMTAAMFALYCLALSAVWVLAVLIAPERAKKWFWPDRTKGAAYRYVTTVNLGLTATFLALVAYSALRARMSPAGVIAGAIGLAAIGVAATFALVTRRSPSSASGPTWQRDFFLARVSFLLIAAAVPAMACFQAAFTLETEVLVRRGELAVHRLGRRCVRIEQAELDRFVERLAEPKSAA